MSKSNILIIFLLILVTLVSSFAQEKLAKQKETFDPMSLNDPSLPILDGSMIYEVITDLQKKTQADLVDSICIVEKMGWKVQFFSTEDFYLADSIYSLAQSLFDNEVQKVYNSPYYKLRVGNCETRSEAEELLQVVREEGFDSAWILSTRIKVKEKKYVY